MGVMTLSMAGNSSTMLADEPGEDPTASVTPQQIRQWARENGIEVPLIGRLSPKIAASYYKAHGMDDALAAQEQRRADKIAARFFAMVDAEGPCWEWTGALDGRGYGVFYEGPGRETQRAHRVAYRLLVGEPPEDVVLDHLCRIHRCVNPDHLDPVSNRENLVRGYGFAGVNIRKSTCPQGHTYDSTRVNRHGNPARFCSRCLRDQLRAKREAQGKPSRRRLTWEEVVEIRARYAAGGTTHVELGRSFGITRDHVGRLLRGQYRNTGPTG